MDARVRQRISWALKCKPSEVPDSPEKIKEALDKRRAKLKRDKEAKYG